LLPTGESSVRNLLSIFELEKALYELQYELDNRPDWLPIPVAGIVRLLESE
jgi:maltokinase